MSIEVKLYNNSGNPNPVYAKDGDAGMDVCANELVVVRPGETRIIRTGLFVGIPKGYELQVRPRSGLSAKTKLRVANSPGTIDSNYRGEIGIIVDNLGGDEICIGAGDRIAQLVLQKVPAIEWLTVNSIEELGETTRGNAGFGSTGV